MQEMIELSKAQQEQPDNPPKAVIFVMPKPAKKSGKRLMVWGNKLLSRRQSKMVFLSYLCFDGVLNFILSILYNYDTDFSALVSFGTLIYFYN